MRTIRILYGAVDGARDHLCRTAGCAKVAKEVEAPSIGQLSISRRLSLSSRRGPGPTVALDTSLRRYDEDARYDTIRLILSPGAGTGGVRQRLAIAAHDGSANCGKRLAGTGSARFTPFYQG